MARLFLSYSHDDAAEEADRLRDLLNQSGHNAWRDREEMRGGKDWKQQIRDALKSVDCVVVLLTPQSVQSEYVEFEWREAVRLEKRVIGVQIKPCDVPAELRDIHYHNHPDEMERFARLSRDLNELDQELAARRRALEDVPLEVVAYVQAAINAYRQRLRRLREQAAQDTPQEPYKELYAFELADEQIFFGRDTDAKQLKRAVLRNRMAVLHARSGAGKTSLLQAGLMPDLITAGYVPIYARTHTDPVASIKRAVTAALPQRPPPELERLTLHAFLRIAEEMLTADSREIVVILDQFEEFFVIQKKSDQREPFIATITECYDDPTLRTRFLIALRGDYFTNLAEFKDYLPRIYHNEYLLPHLTRDQAKDAIVGPIKTVDPDVSYNGALLDELISDLDVSGMELPHLQIICSQLYGERAEAQNEISLADYERLGRASRILGEYLNKTLATFPSAERRIADDLLFELVSSESTKRVLEREKLIATIHAPEAQVDIVLSRLVNDRLLRRDTETEEGKILYEMAHEYLVDEIKRRADADPEKLKLKQVKELLQGAVNAWRQGITASRETLERIYQEQVNLGNLTDEELTCVLVSSIKENFQFRYWINRDSERALRLLYPVVVTTSDTYLRGKILNAWRPLKEEAVAFLIDLLKISDVTLHIRVRDILKVMDIPEALALAYCVDSNIAVNDIRHEMLSLLARFFFSKISDERLQAATLIKQIRDPKVIPSLGYLITKIKNNEIIKEILNNIGTPEALLVLIDFNEIEHKKKKEQELAEQFRHEEEIKLAQQQEREEAKRKLAQQQKHEEAERKLAEQQEREEAERKLAQQREQEKKALIVTLKNQQENIKQILLKPTIEDRDASKYIRDLYIYGTKRTEATEALINLGIQIIPYLIEVLRGKEDFYMGMVCSKILKRLGVNAVVYLYMMLETNPEKEIVILKALKQIDSTEARAVIHEWHKPNGQ